MMMPAQNIFAQRAGLPAAAPAPIARPVMPVNGTIARPVMAPGQIQPGNELARPVMPMQPQQPIQQPVQQAPQNFMRQRLGMY